MLITSLQKKNIFYHLSFKEALQQNIIHDPFNIDWHKLGGDLNGLGGPGDSHLKVSYSRFLLENMINSVILAISIIFIITSISK